MLLSMRPRLSCRLKFRKVVLYVGAVVLTGSLGLLAYLQFYLRCSEGNSVQQTETLCSLYYNKEITGNMCSKLCDENKFKRTQCDGNRWGKKVQIMTCDGCDRPGLTSTVVMKAQFDMEQWDKGVHVQFNKNMTKEEKLRIAKNEINHHSKFFFDTDFSEHPDIISHFLGTDYKELMKGISSNKALDTVLKSAISLAVQWEYLSMKVLGNRRFLPKIYGTCGQAYFVEYTPSLGKFNYVLFQSKVPDMLTTKQYMPSWAERVEIALKLLELILEIEDSYPRPLHMCDIQTHNYGLNNKRDIVLMDSDSVRFESVIPVRNCSDLDCNYLTCHGTCGADKACAKEMVSNNLQTVCKAIFISKAESLGLLRGTPPAIEKQLRNVLQECAYPKHGIYQLPVNNKSDRTVLKAITTLLKSSLKDEISTVNNVD